MYKPACLCLPALLRACPRHATCVNINFRMQPHEFPTFMVQGNANIWASNRLHLYGL